jgi:mannose-1-phosphate guanylyltransferase
MSDMSKVYAVIMAGGSGTRFWPASRKRTPKQLLPLGGGSKTLLAETVDRLAGLVPPENLVVVTAAHLLEATRAVLPKEATILAEPAARNTAPCIAWATWSIMARDPEARVLVLPSDHAIAAPQDFVACIKRALEAAASGTVATIGITPTRPETGYGYIEVGDSVGQGVRKAVRFVEKPNRERAAEYLASGRFLWNAGMFFYRAGDMMKAIRTHLPQLAEQADAMTKDPAGVAELFPLCQSVSIDTGVMEKLDSLYVVPGDFGWNDVGSWESAWELGAKDAEGNVVPEGSVLIDAKRNLVKLLGKQQGKTVALLGVTDLVVVETDDALLVMPKERAQDIRAIVEHLQTAKKTELL